VNFAIRGELLVGKLKRRVPKAALPPEEEQKFGGQKRLKKKGGEG